MQDCSEIASVDGDNIYIYIYIYISMGIENVKILWIAEKFRI